MAEPATCTPSVQGGCFCGTIKYRVVGRPTMSAYCHCTACQRLTGCPFVHTIHFSHSAFSWVHGEPHEDSLEFFDNPLKQWKRRWRCKKCGSTVASYNSKTSNWSVFGAQMERDAEGRIIHWDAVKPTGHIFYTTRMLDVSDALSKWEGYEGNSPLTHHCGPSGDKL